MGWSEEGILINEWVCIALTIRIHKFFKLLLQEYKHTTLQQIHEMRKGWQASVYHQ